MSSKNIVSQLRLAKTDPHSSRTVSLRQLSFNCNYLLVVDVLNYAHKCYSLPIHNVFTVPIGTVIQGDTTERYVYRRLLLSATACIMKFLPSFWSQYLLRLTALVLLISYSLLNNVSMNCVICISTPIHTAFTDSIMHVFVHFSSEENSQKCCHQSSLFGSYMHQIVCRPFVPDFTGGAHNAP